MADLNDPSTSETNYIYTQLNTLTSMFRIKCSAAWIIILSKYWQNVYTECKWKMSKLMFQQIFIVNTFNFFPYHLSCQLMIMFWVFFADTLAVWLKTPTIKQTLIRWVAMYKHAWSPEDESYWLRWSPDFSSPPCGSHLRLWVKYLSYNISSAIGWMAMKIGAHVHAPHNRKGWLWWFWKFFMCNT